MSTGIGSVGTVTVDPVCIKGTTPENGGSVTLKSTEATNETKWLIIGTVAGGLLVSIVIIGVGLAIYFAKKRSFEK